MEFLQGVLLVAHLIGFAAVLGSAMAQLSNLKSKSASVSPGILHGSNLLFVTGILLIVVVYARGGQVDVVKMVVKTLVLVVLTVVVIVGRRRVPASGAVIGGVLGLSVLNAALAVLWH